MSAAPTRFPLREETIIVRGESVRIRELTQLQATEVYQTVGKNPAGLVSLYVSLGCVDPSYSLEEAQALPLSVSREISKSVMRLSGLLDDDEEGGSKNA